MRQSKQQLPDSDARQSVLQAIEQSEAPVSAKVLAKLPGIGNAARIDRLIKDDLDAGRIFGWGSKVYWRVDPTQTTRERFSAAVESEFLPKAKLISRVAQQEPKIRPALARSVLQEFLAAKRFQEMPDPGSKTKGIVDPENPAPYLERVFSSLGVTRSVDSIRSFISSGDQPAAQTPVKPESRGSDTAALADRLFAALNRIAFSPGATVTFDRLRQQPELVDVPKSVFDQAALLLQQDRRALLSAHGYAARLPEEERERLVTDGFGNYYVSIYAR